MPAFQFNTPEYNSTPPATGGTVVASNPSGVLSPEEFYQAYFNKDPAQVGVLGGNKPNADGPFNTHSINNLYQSYLNGKTLDQNFTSQYGTALNPYLPNQPTTDPTASTPSGGFTPWQGNDFYNNQIGPGSSAATGAAQDLANATTGTINPAAQQVGAFGQSLVDNPFNFGSGVQDYFNLLTQAQQPGINNQWNTLTNDLYNKGQLGSFGTAGDRALQSFGQGVSQADSQNLLSAMNFGQQGQIAGGQLSLQALQPQLGAFNQAQVYPNSLQWQTGLPLQLQLGQLSNQQPKGPNAFESLLGGVASGAGAYFGAHL